LLALCVAGVAFCRTQRRMSTSFAARAVGFPTAPFTAAANRSATPPPARRVDARMPEELVSASCAHSTACAFTSTRRRAAPPSRRLDIDLGPDRGRGRAAIRRGPDRSGELQLRFTLCCSTVDLQFAAACAICHFPTRKCTKIANQRAVAGGYHAPHMVSNTSILVSVCAATSLSLPMYGCAGDDAVPDPAVPVTIAGTVRGNRAGVTVGIVGKPSVISGPNGEFVFTDVTRPYDIYTFVDLPRSSPTAWVYQGVTRLNPVVSALEDFPLPHPCGVFEGRCPGATVTGTRTGAGNNTDPIRFVWTGDHGFAASQQLNADGTYSVGIVWAGDAESHGTLHALQYAKKPSGAPDSFVGYATSGPTVLSEDGTTTINLEATAVDSIALHGTISTPSGYPLPAISLIQNFGSTPVTLWTATTQTPDAAFPRLPSAGPTTLTALAKTERSGATVVLPLTGSGDVNITIPSSPALEWPPDGASDVTSSTRFTWTSDAAIDAPALNRLDVSVTSGDKSFAYRIFTTASGASIPAIPELPFPPSGSGRWIVAASLPSSVDDAVASGQPDDVPRTQLSSERRSFEAVP
jgi:hypothetical protein